MKYNVQISKNASPILAIEDFIVEKNGINFLLGESGIGKTLISKSIYGLADPDELDIRINGEDYRKYKNSETCREIIQNSFYVFQEPSSHLNPLVRIKTQLNEGSLQRLSNDNELLQSLWPDNEKDKPAKIINVYPKPYRPSGGEKQRLLTAMALKKCDIYLQNKSAGETFFVFDEPTGNLDDYNRDILISGIFDRFRKRNFTILFITHDYSVISALYEKHEDLVDKAYFKELYRENEKLGLRKFKPEDYMTWLEEEKKDSHGKSGEIILEAESGIEIFGMKLNFYKNGKQTSLKIRKGAIAYLKAPSGIGKTTIVKILMGLYSSGKLKMRVEGEEITEKTPQSYWSRSLWGKKMTMSFQHADEALNLNSNVRDVFKGLPVKGLSDDNKLLVAIRKLLPGIPDKFLDKKVWQLSGGQKQKINLMRSFVLNTDIIILDEPTSGMDFASIRSVISMIKQKEAEGKSLLIISHDEEIFDAVVKPEYVFQLKSETL